MDVFKNCEICGKEFVGFRRNVRFCSEPCRAVARKEKNRMLSAERAKKKRRKEDGKVQIWQLNEEARRLGLSYGQYQAMRYAKGG